MSRADDRLLRRLHRHGRDAAVRDGIGTGRPRLDGAATDAGATALQTTALQPAESIARSQGRPLVQVVT